MNLGGFPIAPQTPFGLKYINLNLGALRPPLPNRTSHTLVLLDGLRMGTVTQIKDLDSSSSDPPPDPLRLENINLNLGTLRPHPKPFRFELINILICVRRVLLTLGKERNQTPSFLGNAK